MATIEIFDISIYESGTGGDLNVYNDDLEASKGLANQVYLALFGGNIEENTTEQLDNASERNDWFGNAYLQSEFQFNSYFEREINNIVLTSGGISKLIDAAKKDLKYLQKYADITIEGSIPSLNRFTLDVYLKQPNQTSQKISFIWDSMKKEVIQTIII